MFTYWGRRGALTQFTLELAKAALAKEDLTATISTSRQNESFANFRQLGAALFAIDTFRSHAGSLMQAWRIPLLRRRLYERVKRDRVQAVIELMPHVWSPMVMPVLRTAGVRYCTVIHDADAHPGDYTSWVKSVIDRSMPSADLVFALSSSVATQLLATRRVPQAKLCTLFHPDLSYAVPTQRPELTSPLRLMFFGRIMPYKGLPMFLDMVDCLRADGIAVEVGVFGEGRLGSSAERLRNMGAEVINRWLAEAEVASLLARFHAIVLSHTEASQSGVAAAAFGAGIPVIATPVGGLVEQVIDGVNGMVALRADPIALAHAVKRLLLEPAVYSATCQNIERFRGQRSMARFVNDIVHQSLHARSGAA